jgi:hypothetical protein
VPYAGHVSRSSNFFDLENFLALSAMATVLSGLRFLPYCSLLCWFRLSELSWLFRSGNLSRVFSFAAIIFSPVRLNSSLLRGFYL